MSGHVSTDLECEWPDPGWPAGHPAKDRSNCHLWVVCVTGAVFHDVIITVCYRRSVCHLLVGNFPQFEQLNWAHVQVLHSATMRRHSGAIGRGDVERNDTCHSPPVNGSILAITSGCTSDHRILTEFHKLIINYEKS